MHRWGLVITCALLASCAAHDTTALDPEPASARDRAVLDYKQQVARELALQLGADPARRDRLIAALRAGPMAIGPELGLATPELTAFDAVPELSLVAAPTASVDGLLVAHAPAGDEASWTAIPAYASDGARVVLDVESPPEVAVIVVETHGRLAFRRGVADANHALQRLGMQRTSRDKAVGRATVRLDQIRLADDQEPWVSGAAEIYVIASGVIGNNQPELRVVELPYLDYAGTSYTPRQVVLDWSDYAYRAANVQLFEHDDSTSYQTLVVELVAAVGALGSLAGHPEIQAVTGIASRIVAAMPAGWFSNDDDYIDSFYTVERDATYSGLTGAARNASVTLVPYYLAPNE